MMSQRCVTIFGSIKWWQKLLVDQTIFFSKENVCLTNKSKIEIFLPLWLVWTPPKMLAKKSQAVQGEKR